MRTVAIVFRKELIDQIRDRRTIMFMIVIPLILFPVLFKVMFTVQKSTQDKAKAKTLRVACVDHGNAAEFVGMLAGREGIRVVRGVPEDSLRSFIRQDSLDGAFVFDRDFDETVADLAAGRVDFYYKMTDDTRIVRNRLSDMVDEYEEKILSERFERLALDGGIVEGIDLRSHNVATMQERIGHEVGGFLPYIFILFCFLGSMYPAIDLAAGEKERGTLETLLTAPVNRFHILVGKFGVVVLSGVGSAVVSMLGLFIGFKQAGEIPPEFLQVIVKILGMNNILLLFSLLLPLTVFFAGALLSISLAAKSFKEAQSLVSPLNMAILVPAAIGMIPGVHMNVTTAIIPVLNVSLATKAIIGGTMQTSHLAIVYTSLIAFATLSLYASAQWFRRESIIFRT